MRPTETCEACGQDVASDEARRAELTIGDMMCPTPMVLHEECYEQASEVWETSDTSCSSPDPEFPETERWVTFPGRSTLG